MATRDLPQPAHPAAAMAAAYEQIRALRAEMKAMLREDRVRIALLEAKISAMVNWQSYVTSPFAMGAVDGLWDVVAAFDVGDPGLTVDIAVIASGYVRNFTGDGVAKMRVGISTDGGSSYTYGPEIEEATVQGTAAVFLNRNPTVAMAAQAAVTPTNNVLARLEVQPLQHGSNELVGGVLHVIMTPT
jgi:hypothetical protein